MALRKNNIEVSDQLIRSFISRENSEISIYIKILQLVTNATKTRITIGIFNIDGMDNNILMSPTEIPYKEYEFTPDLLISKNFIEQGYDYLKTLQEFSGCEDC